MSNQSRKGEPIRRTGRGFTLIELLVVVAIIAVLIAILLPALGQAREQARTTACLANDRQIGLALMYYTNEYGGHIPFLEVSGTNRQEFWSSKLLPYISDKYKGSAGMTAPPVYTCPSRREVIVMRANDILCDYAVSYGGYNKVKPSAGAGLFQYCDAANPNSYRQ